MIPPGRMLIWLVAGLGVSTGFGCKPKPKPVTELQRKQAAHLESEAQFALTMRDWPRAESSLAQAVQLDPNNGQYWLALGSTRVRLGNKSRAREAYEGALKAFQVEARGDTGKKDPEPWLSQVQTLALLGRTEEARALLDKVAKQFPDNRTVRGFVQDKQFDRMIEDPNFRQVAL